jgi:hypothetical protein
METGPKRASIGSRSFWRWLVGAAFAYALIMQPLVLATAVAELANASAIDGFAQSQLCVHATDGGPLLPAGPQKPSADHHCAFCFAGSFHLLDALRPAIVQYVRSGMRKVRHSVHPPSLTSVSQYSVACPRGPPLSE